MLLAEADAAPLSNQGRKALYFLVASID